MRVNEQAVKNILKSVGNAKLVAATKYVGIEEINELEKLLSDISTRGYGL